MLYVSVPQEDLFFPDLCITTLCTIFMMTFIGQYILHKNILENLQTRTLLIRIIIYSLLMVSLRILTIICSPRWPNIHLFIAALKRDDPQSPPICFEDAIIGNSKDGIWYDYGFYDDPQGPLQKPLTGKFAQDAANYLRLLSIKNAKQFKDQELLKKIKERKRNDSHKISMDYYISIFSRTQDRLILNEREMMKELDRAFGLPVKLVQLEKFEI